MLTKTEEKVMEVFVSAITKNSSIKEISEKIQKPYPLIHRSINNLIKKNLLSRDERKLVSLNYKKHIEELAYVEFLRKEEKLKNQKSVSLFIEDCLKQIKEDFFIFLIFGSFVEKKDFGDIDILIIVKEQNQIENLEKLIRNIAENFSFKVDLNIVSLESAYEMLSKREQTNILNESLNKHIIVFGAENYYRTIKNAR